MKRWGDTAKSPLIVLVSARVLFTYTPSHDDELPLREVGQIITVLSKSADDPGWLVAEIDGEKGLIPDNFVEMLSSTIPTPASSENQKVFFFKGRCFMSTFNSFITGKRNACQNLSILESTVCSN